MKSFKKFVLSEAPNPQFNPGETWGYNHETDSFKNCTSGLPYANRKLLDAHTYLTFSRGEHPSLRYVDYTGNDLVYNRVHKAAKRAKEVDPSLHHIEHSYMGLDMFKIDEAAEDKITFKPGDIWALHHPTNTLHNITDGLYKHAIDNPKLYGLTTRQHNSLTLSNGYPYDSTVKTHYKINRQVSHAAFLSNGTQIEINDYSGNTDGIMKARKDKLHQLLIQHDPSIEHIHVEK